MNISTTTLRLIAAFCLLAIAKGETFHIRALVPREQQQLASRVAASRALPLATPHDTLSFECGTEQIRYVLYRPPTGGTNPSARFPLVVVLHHAGAEKRWEDLLTMNPESIGCWLQPDVRQEHPCFVVAPWSGGRHWEEGDWATITPLAAQPSRNAKLVLGLIDHLKLDLPIDSARIYLVGQSMGGFGVWELLSRRPELFAAAIPVCGGGDPAQAPRMGNIPIWSFHGDADSVIPVSRTRMMEAELEGLGSHSSRYWEFTGANHDECSERAFTEPSLANWLFAR